MDDAVRQKLRESVAGHGPLTGEGAQSVREALAGLGREYRREAFALAAALDADVPSALLQSPRGVPLEAVLSDLTRRLCDDTGLAEEAARWAVAAWAEALGLAAAPSGAVVTPAGTPPSAAGAAAPAGDSPVPRLVGDVQDPDVQRLQLVHRFADDLYFLFSVQSRPP